MSQKYSATVEPAESSRLGGEPAAEAARWLTRLEEALAGEARATVARLFAPGALWKDLFILGAQPALIAVGDEAAALPDDARRLHDLQVSPRRTGPRAVRRAGVESVEVFFEFVTPDGGGEGLVRLFEADGTVLAREMFTSLSRVSSAPEQIGHVGPGHEDGTHDFAEPTWYETRAVRSRFHERDPEVLVVGAGQAGLSLAARLGRLGIDVLVVEDNARVGDNWRHRYRSLQLHNQAAVIGLPYFPSLPVWERYLSKDRVADWLEYYANALDIPCWTSTTLESAEQGSTGWTAAVTLSDGSRRLLKPRHLVMATGVSGSPRLPRIAGMSSFDGPVLHSTQYDDGAPFAGQRALVIGTGSSGHDIAQDLHAHGAQVAMLQRGAMTVSSIPAVARTLDAEYSTLPQDDADYIGASFPLPSYIRVQQDITRRLRELDAELLEGLASAGFNIDFGVDETGPLLKYLRHGGGFYLNAGCSDLIVSGDVDIIQASDVLDLVPAGLQMTSGAVREFDVIVAATGYEAQHVTLARVFGQEVAQGLGPVWGIDEAGVPSNVWRPTRYEGLWFMLGNFQQCRFYSRLLALQIARALRVPPGDAEAHAPA